MNRRLAQVLAEAGLRESTRRLLMGCRGRDPGRLRIQVEGRSPSPGVYGLFLLDETAAICVPIAPCTSSRWPRDEASQDAAEHAAADFGTDRMPAFALDLGHMLDVDGGSAGLAIYLALLRWGSDRKLRLPVFATAAVASPDGHLGSVTHLEVKVRAALADLGDRDGLVLVPSEPALPAALQDARVHRLGSLEEARELVFGPEALTPHPSRFSVETRLQEAERLSDPAAVLSALEALRPALCYPEDHLRVELLCGIQLRHLGRADEAVQVHAQALRDARGQLREGALERMEIEHYNSRLDLFMDLEQVVEYFAERTSRDFVLPATELYARGIYSRALAMLGHFDRAIDERRRALPLHEHSEALAREGGQSYAELLLCHALASRQEGVEEVVAELQAATKRSSDQDGQRAYTLASMLRAAVAFGWVDDALAWVRAETPLLGVAPLPQASFLRTDAPISGHPHITIARAYARLLRRAGRASDAAKLLGRVQDAYGLIGWLVEVGRLELALALHDLDDVPGAERAREAAFTRMHELHGGATQRYFPAAEMSWSALERAIDVVWY